MTRIPRSLTITRTGYGEGFTWEEAFDNWLETDPQLQKDGVSFGRDALLPNRLVRVQLSRRPFNPKYADISLNRTPRTPWYTQYTVTDQSGIVQHRTKTKGDAIRWARDHAARTRVWLQIHQVKEQDPPRPAEVTISPRPGRPGKWKFSAVFRY